MEKVEMKKYKIIYSPSYHSKVIMETHINALCESDAINFFFDNVGGKFLGCEFVEWIK